MEPEINIFIPIFYGLLLIGLPVSVGIILAISKNIRNRLGIYTDSDIHEETK